MGITAFSPGLKMLRLTLCLIMCVLAVNTYDLDKPDVDHISKELANIASVSLSRSSANEKKRNPKLFFVSSTTSTSLAVTLCWVSTLNTAVTQCGKRRRSIKTSAEESFLEDGISRTTHLDSSGAGETESERKAKFLLYWLTTTTTITTFTGTSTIASINCTPAGYTVNQCG